MITQMAISNKRCRDCLAGLESLIHEEDCSAPLNNYEGPWHRRSRHRLQHQKQRSQADRRDSDS